MSHRRRRLDFESLEGKALLSGLSASLTTNQAAYHVGQPVVMTFQETNVSDQPIAVEDGPSIDGFYVTQGDRVVWRSNSGAVPMFLRMDELQPGQSLTLTDTWDGVPNNGTAPATGTFVVSNQLDPGVTATISIGGDSSGGSGSSNAPTGPTQPIGVITDPDPIAQPAPSPSSPTTSDPGPSGPSTPPATSTPDSAPIAVSIVSDPRGYREGRSVRLAMTVTNVGDATITLPKPSDGEFTVFEGTTPIWHRAQSIRSRVLRPGQTIKISTLLDLKGKSHPAGVTLAAGTYTLEASAAGGSSTSILEMLA